MTDAGHVWIVTEQALFSNNTPVGTLGLKLNNDNETEHIRVSRSGVNHVRSWPDKSKWFLLEKKIDGFFNIEKAFH